MRKRDTDPAAEPASGPASGATFERAIPSFTHFGFETVTEAEKTTRIMELQALQKTIQTDLHATQVGRRIQVLTDSVSRRRENELAGRSTQNTVVNFPGPTTWLGKTLDVLIQRAGPNSLWGEVASRP